MTFFFQHSQVLAKAVCCSVSPTTPSPRLLLLRLELTLKFGRSSWTANVSNCKFGILRVKNGSVQLQPVIMSMQTRFDLFCAIIIIPFFYSSRCLIYDHYVAYYRGAMGILLVYDVTDGSSFNSILVTPSIFAGNEYDLKPPSCKLCLS